MPTIKSENFKLPKGVASHFVMVGDVRTHYLEAGAKNDDADAVILLHSAEYGGRALYSWFANIGELGKHFHVYAPDLIGFGYTDKIHDFVKAWDNRVDHVRKFMETLCIPAAHFAGSSFAGGLIQRIAVMEPSPWNILSITSISGGGPFPDSPARRTLLGYDGTKEWMKQLLQMLCYEPKWWTDSIVEEKWQASIEPGAWEALSAARFTRPGAERPLAVPAPDVSKIKQPTFMAYGDRDELRTLADQATLSKQIPGCFDRMYSPAKHNSHYECADAFNKDLIGFLSKHSTKKQPQPARA